MDKKSLEYGKQFHCSFDIFENPKEFDILTLYQCGEMSCEQGFIVQEHRQTCYEISCFIGGEGYNYCGDEKYPVKEGDIFINVPGDCHKIVSSDTAPLRFLYMGWKFSDRVAEHFLPIVEFFEKPLEHPLMQDRFGVSFYLSKLVSEFYNSTDFSEEMVNSYVFQILCLLYRTWQMPKYPAELSRKGNSVGGTVYRVIQYVDNNIYDIDNVGTICRDLCYSSSYLSRVFHARTGTTLQHYLNEKKIESAEALIKGSGLSMTEIAEKLHFDSVQSFSRIFKRIAGVSPSHYAKSLTEQRD